MTTFWDHGLHATLLRETAHRNGYTTKVRLGFNIDLLQHDQVKLSVTFHELERTMIRAIAYRGTYIEPVCEPPWGTASFTTPRDRLDNLIEFINQGMPQHFIFTVAMHQINNSRAAERRPVKPNPAMPGTPPGLAPITDITIKLRKS